MFSKSLFLLLGFGCICASAASYGEGAAFEANPVRQHPRPLGAETQRLLVGFRATLANASIKALSVRGGVRVTQARTSSIDVQNLAVRAALKLDHSRQLTPDMHVMYLQRTLYGADVEAALTALRADPSVEFAAIDERRYLHALPNDPLLPASVGATGQWYLQTPTATDPAATDTVSAWALSTGSAGTVIADVDTGVRFDHPDLLRAGFGGRLLPGYDFVSQDYSRSSGAPLGTYLTANDGDGWDPDPSDPGDWLNASDEMNALFPQSACGNPADSSWHGTRVMGILGALTDNGVGIAALDWSSYDLPVRSLGKCGGYDSDIIAGMQWAAGLSVSGAPDNPYPADIINMSLGGSGACPTSYTSAISTLVSMGVLVVASAGNESGPVDTPANCPGVLGVAGLRNVGTKVGYSSLGAEVGIAAPAGNCVNSSGPCLRSIDTTTNAGLTVASTNGYTSQINPNLGTSFSAPIVSGIASLMRSVNANLTPPQLIARIKSSATPFPHPTGVPICPAVASDGSGECACPNDASQCGAGMINAYKAVSAALRPIAAVTLPGSIGAGSDVVFDASGSAAACNASIASYLWTVSGGVTLASGQNAARVSVTTSGSGGTLTLTVTDSAGATDSALVTIGTTSATSGAPATAGSAASACATPRSVSIAAPIITAAFAPATVAVNSPSLLTLTLRNTNAFALTQTQFAYTLPSGLQMATKSAAGASVTPLTTCVSVDSPFTYTTTSVALSASLIPQTGSCTVTIPVQSSVAGTYTTSVAAGALSTGPAGVNTAAASATVTINAASSGGGGGSIDWTDMLLVTGVLLAGRRGIKRRVDTPPRGNRRR